MINLETIKKRIEEFKANKAQRKVVMAFAKKMIAKLELKSKEKGRPSFLGNNRYVSSWWYYKKLGQEIKELQRALNRHDIQHNEKICKAVINECYNVANFCVAIAENMENGK